MKLAAMSAAGIKALLVEIAFRTRPESSSLPIVGIHSISIKTSL